MMSAQILGFPESSPLGRRRAEISRRGVQIDFSTWLGKLERTLVWLDRSGIEISAFACSTFKGARVHVISCGILRTLLCDERVSRGHRQFGASRIEQWEARDPVTGVLIVWEEEASA